MCAFLYTAVVEEEEEEEEEEGEEGSVARNEPSPSPEDHIKLAKLIAQ